MYFEVFGEREGCGPGEVRIGRAQGADVRVERLPGPDHASQGQGGRRAGRPEVWQRMQRIAPAERHAGSARQAGSRAGGLRSSRKRPSFSAPASRPTTPPSRRLTEKGDVMICDHNLHASLVEGALRSPARTMRFRHNDLEHFERCLENCPPDEKIFIVSEGVFSMEGDHRRPARHSEAGQALRRARVRGRGARHRRAGAHRRGRRRAPGRAGRSGYRHGHVQQVAGVGGRVRRVRTRGDRLPEAHRAAVRLFGQPAAGLGGGGGRGAARS